MLLMSHIITDLISLFSLLTRIMKYILRMNYTVINILNL